MTNAIVQPIKRIDTSPGAFAVVSRNIKWIESESCCDEESIEVAWMQFHPPTKRTSCWSWGYEFDSDDYHDYRSEPFWLMEQPPYCPWCGAKHDITILPEKTFERVIEKEVEEVPVTTTETRETVVRDEWVEVVE